MRKTRQCRHGVFTYYTQDYYIGNALEVTGENSPGELDRLKTLVPPSGHVVMVGANIGTLAVPMARHLAQGSLLAFEPEPKTFSLLFENFVQNGLNPTAPLRLAVGDRCGRARLTTVDYDAACYNSGAGTVTTDTSVAAVEVDMITLDSLDLSNLDLLHADCEGSELAVVQGAAGTIRRHRPFLYLENNHRRHSAALIRTVTALGYSCHWHFPQLFNPDPNGGILVSINMLCLPTGRPFPAAALADTMQVLSEDENCDHVYGRLSEKLRVLTPPSPRSMRY